MTTPEIQVLINTIRSSADNIERMLGMSGSDEDTSEEKPISTYSHLKVGESNGVEIWVQNDGTILVMARGRKFELHGVFTIDEFKKAVNIATKINDMK